MCVESFHVVWGFIVLLLFFFFKQKTAYEIRISDWSSDVCSSDLLDLRLLAHPKTPTLVSARSPITVGGAFSRPSVGIEAAPLGARAAGDRKSTRLNSSH